MQHIQISEVIRRYHLNAQQMHYKERLNRMTEHLLREYLDLALKPLGYRESDLVCIRDLNVPIVFNPDKTDIENFQDWLSQLQSSLTRMQKTDLVHYGSMIDALVALGKDIAARNLNKLWVWKSIGIAKTHTNSVSVLTADWVDYLTGNSYYNYLVINRLQSSEVYRSKPLLMTLIDQSAITTADFKKLATTYLQTHFDDIHWQRFEQEFRSEISKLESLHQTYTQLDQELKRLASRLGKGSIRSLSNSSLTKLEGLLEALLGNVDYLRFNQLSAEQFSLLVQILLLTEFENNGLLTKSWAGDTESIMQQSLAIILKLKLTNLFLVDEQVDKASQNAPLSSDYSRILSVSASENQKNSAELSEIISQFGGLAYVFNLLLTDAWQAKLKALTKHGLPLESMLEHLCVNLLPIDHNEPIVQLFSGSLFDNKVDKPLERVDLSLINDEIVALSKELKVSFQQRILGSLGQNIDKFFENICKRRVKIEGQKGWINIFFDINDVSTEIRACGLDLDPGYIPWLGCVVKFYYE